MKSSPKLPVNFRQLCATLDLAINLHFYLRNISFAWEERELFLTGPLPAINALPATKEALEGQLEELIRATAYVGGQPLIRVLLESSMLGQQGRALREQTFQGAQALRRSHAEGGVCLIEEIEHDFATWLAGRNRFKVDEPLDLLLFPPAAHRDQAQDGGAPILACTAEVLARGSATCRESAFRFAPVLQSGDALFTQRDESPLRACSPSARTLHDALSLAVMRVIAPHTHRFTIPLEELATAAGASTSQVAGAARELMRVGVVCARESFAFDRVWHLQRSGPFLVAKAGEWSVTL